MLKVDICAFWLDFLILLKQLRLKNTTFFNEKLVFSVYLDIDKLPGQQTGRFLEIPGRFANSRFYGPGFK